MVNRVPAAAVHLVLFPDGWSSLPACCCSVIARQPRESHRMGSLCRGLSHPHSDAAGHSHAAENPM